MKAKTVMNKLYLLTLIVGMCVMPLSVSAQSIIPGDKPEIIKEESDLSGKVDSYIQGQEDKISNLPTINDDNLNINKESSSEDVMNPDAFLENTNMTISDFGNVIISRMIDVVEFFQGFAKPFSIIMFILSGLLVLVSTVFGGKNTKLGLLGMMFAVFCYVGSMFAPDLVMFFSQWLSV